MYSNPPFRPPPTPPHHRYSVPSLRPPPTPLQVLRTPFGTVLQPPTQELQPCFETPSQARFGTPCYALLPLFWNPPRYSNPLLEPFPRSAPLHPFLLKFLPWCWNCQLLFSGDPCPSADAPASCGTSIVMTGVYYQLPVGVWHGTINVLPTYASELFRH